MKHFRFPKDLSMKRNWTSKCTLEHVCVCRFSCIHTVFEFIMSCKNNNVFRRRFERYFSHHQARCEAVKCGIFARRAMVDQAREGLCCQRINLTLLIGLTMIRLPVLTYHNFVPFKIMLLLCSS